MNALMTIINIIPALIAAIKAIEAAVPGGAVHMAESF